LISLTTYILRLCLTILMRFKENAAFLSSSDSSHSSFTADYSKIGSLLAIVYANFLLIAMVSKMICLKEVINYKSILHSLADLREFMIAYTFMKFSYSTSN
jgi:hypothetical protein